MEIIPNPAPSNRLNLPRKGLKKIKSVVISGDQLNLHNLIEVSRFGASVELSSAEDVLMRLSASQHYIERAVEQGKPIYGVTTGFGGMGHVSICLEELAELQSNLLWFLKAGTGERLPDPDVRAGMLLRANALMRGASGVRLELLERIALFLNAGVTPHVMNLGSIGASGDLVPLANVAGALIGISDDYLVDYQGETMGALAALEQMSLKPLTLAPKEGLALVNGTSMLTAIAAGCLYDSLQITALAFAAHALMLQGLSASNQPFHPYIHDHKPHPGQRFAAARMLELLSGSMLIRDELAGLASHGEGRLIQDRYSIRCFPQFVGPIIDGLAMINRQVEIEMNSATDNPLLDPEADASYHGGNYLGQYVAIGMDHLRYYLGLLAKHLDVQISLLMEPGFSGGLNGSLVGNPDRRVNMGLKGLQLAGNSIMPLINFYGNSLADRFPTHAEQFNQNINSQGFGSANLARQSVDLFQRYLAIALIVGVQAVDLRTRYSMGHGDTRSCLSPATLGVYEVVYELVDRQPSLDRPLIFNDHEQSLDCYLAHLVADIAGEGRLVKAVESLIEHLWEYVNNGSI